MELTVTIRDADVPTLQSLAKKNWRDDAPQASAILEQFLQAERKRVESPHTGRRGGRARTTGITVAA